MTSSEGNNKRDACQLSDNETSVKKKRLDEDQDLQNEFTAKETTGNTSPIVALNISKEAKQDAEICEVLDTGSSISKASTCTSDKEENLGLSREAGMDLSEMPSAERGEEIPMLDGLKEKDVGISEYVSKHEGFFGILKQRYRDFLVNEIDEAGNVVRLTDLSYPTDEGEKPVDINAILSKEDQEQLAQLMQTEDAEASYLIQVGDDKDQRTRVHQAIRQLYPSMESGTINMDADRKAIKVSKLKPGVKRRRSIWPKKCPDYCKFVLHKENMDLNEALGLIARYLHINPKNFGMAGNKDKRAVTSQEITAYRITAARLGRLNDVLRGIRLGNFRYVNRPLNLGELSGNHFAIVLRNAKCSQEQVDAVMASFKDVGFIHYFGMQRFGNSTVATYMVGKALLLCKWSEAVDMILKPRGGSEKDDNKWREHWMKHKNAESTLQMIPWHKRTSAEFQLLKGLVKVEKSDPFKALLYIPRHIRLLYVHSYQSYVWNCIVSRRTQKYGLQPIVGDLVAMENQLPAEQDSALKTAYITKDNIDQYSIYDVVLPMPGYGITYPNNEVGEWIKSTLSEDGLLAIVNTKHRVKDYSLFGAYRKILVKPKNVIWSLQKYSDYKLHLIQTDLDKLEGKEVPEQTDCTEQALKMEFSLPSSSYATMAIREILKIDTSALHQASLNTK